MPVRVDKQGGRVVGQVLAGLLGVAVALLLVQVAQSPLVQDTWKGIWYEAEAKVDEIETALDLTDTGRRIFRASSPTVEGREDFNEHCENRRAEVSLLGCYMGGRIYIYEITEQQLADSNKVTAAHELLHAVWERMNDRERAEITKVIEAIGGESAEWLEGELATYAEEDKIEEAYARIGTKLIEIPEELEDNYRKYFRNREVIVRYYETVQAPFRELQTRNDELRLEIFAGKEEIADERDKYLTEVENLNEEIDAFNACAAQTGCFTAEEFAVRREVLAARQASLNRRREELNDKIEENNARVEEYHRNQAEFGELSEAMDSRIEKGDLIYE